MVLNKNGEDATEVFDLLFAPEIRYAYLNCLDELYYMGVIDNNRNQLCHGLNIAMFALLIIVASLLILQVICSLLYVARRNRTLSKAMSEKKVMVMVPCYNEGDKELRKTIQSVVETDYPDESKVLLVIADGIITGRGESMSTPQVLAKLLGFTFNKEADTAHFYKSIGSSERNRAFVYHGTHKRETRELKYIVVVKCGTSAERSSPPRG